MLPITTAARLSFGVVAICTFCFVDDVTVSHYGPMARHVYSSAANEHDKHNSRDSNKMLLYVSCATWAKSAIYDFLAFWSFIVHSMHKLQFFLTFITIIVSACCYAQCNELGCAATDGNVKRQLVNSVIYPPIPGLSHLIGVVSCYGDRCHLIENTRHYTSRPMTPIH